MQAAAVGMVLGKVPWSKVFQVAPRVVDEAIDICKKLMELRQSRSQDRERIEDLIDQQTRVIAQMGQVQVAMLKWIIALAAATVIALGVAVAALIVALVQ